MSVLEWDLSLIWINQFRTVRVNVASCWMMFASLPEEQGDNVATMLQCRLIICLQELLLLSSSHKPCLFQLMIEFEDLI